MSFSTRSTETTRFGISFMNAGVLADSLSCTVAWPLVHFGVTAGKLLASKFTTRFRR